MGELLQEAEALVLKRELQRAEQKKAEEKEKKKAKKKEDKKKKKRKEKKKMKKEKAKAKSKARKTKDSSSSPSSSSSSSSSSSPDTSDSSDSSDSESIDLSGGGPSRRRPHARGKRSGRVDDPFDDGAETDTDSLLARDEDGLTRRLQRTSISADHNEDRQHIPSSSALGAARELTREGEGGGGSGPLKPPSFELPFGATAAGDDPNASAPVGDDAMMIDDTPVDDVDIVPRPVLGEEIGLNQDLGTHVREVRDRASPAALHHAPLPALVQLPPSTKTRDTHVFLPLICGDTNHRPN